jgi:hypothetical protein
MVRKNVVAALSMRKVDFITVGIVWHVDRRGARHHRSGMVTPPSGCGQDGAHSGAVTGCLNEDSRELHRLTLLVGLQLAVDTVPHSVVEGVALDDSTSLSSEERSGSMTF